MISGGKAVARALLAAGVDHAFCVPGESFLGLLDALYDTPRIRVIATRHEGGAAFMAEAFGKLTRRPAVCMGTRMVGAGNLAIGIHTAHQDSSPMLALLGQVATGERHREAFQESELAQVFAPVAKWSVEPPRADRLGELTLRAARIALSGRPGPVVISLREDLLTESVDDFEPQPLRLAKPAPESHAIEAALRQELEHPGRQIATALGPVDFAAMARALGADGVTVRDEHEFSPLLQDALRSQKPTVFHLQVDPEQISVASDVA